MSMLRNLSVQLVRSAPRVMAVRPVLAAPSFIRFKSDSTIPITTEKDISLTAQIYPIDKETITEEDVDEWLGSLKTLKSGKSVPESPTEAYLSHLSNPAPFLKEKFEPTEEQLAEVEAYSNTSIPILTDPTVENLINLIMRHGKKAKAQKIVSRALYIIHLKIRKDPVEILKETLDKLGPLVTTKSFKTGTAKSRIVPIPLNRRQRNRLAITWILEGSSKKKSNDLAVRLAEEIISAYEGKSSGYDKKANMHKTAMQQRAYIQL
ncbi:ribosomal protein S7 domain-containing protein [Scheffersomyces amazonensis]|uniref:ribosomal protein S7 domain-containing protein n=1 Tax=Scheffersomyces amazonensis TaxID=1078765 RepID=UPI00315D8CC6